MKKTIVTLMLLSGVAMADTTLLDMDFTALTGSTNDNTPEGWTAGQWNGNNNTPYYNFGNTGAVVGEPWKQNYLYTEIELSSQADATISFTLYNSVENTGNMFYLSSDTYSIVMGNSYDSNSEIYVGTLEEAVGRDFVCFQTNTKINPNVLANSTGYNVSGTIEYTLTLSGGDMLIKATADNGSTWSYSLEGMENVTFDKVGFATDGDPGTAGVKDITITVVPEPTTATLSLLALAGLAARRRRK